MFLCILCWNLAYASYNLFFSGICHFLQWFVVVLSVTNTVDLKLSTLYLICGYVVRHFLYFWILAVTNTAHFVFLSDSSQILCHRLLPSPPLESSQVFKRICRYANKNYPSNVSWLSDDARVSNGCLFWPGLAWPPKFYNEYDTNPTTRDRGRFGSCLVCFWSLFSKVISTRGTLRVC